MINYLFQIRWQDIVDIIIVAFIVYRIFLFIKGTRARQIVVGLAIVLFVYFISKRFEFFTLSWILSNFVTSLVIVIVIIFQDDIRRFLLALGRSPFFKKITYVKETLFFEELVNACTALAQRKNGALIVIEREVGLEEFTEVGLPLDAEMNTELLISIFQYASPLHDGAVILREGRIKAAGCILPVTMKDGIGKDLGTRHRAAIGITEVTDAIAIAISEEKGHISYAYKGNIITGISGDTLHRILREFLT